MKLIICQNCKKLIGCRFNNRIRYCKECDFCVYPFTLLSKNCDYRIKCNKCVKNKGNEKKKTDRLAEATFGKLHWNDPGMNDLEKGWEDFPKGTRVEVRCCDGIWRKGTVVKTVEDNERGIEVICDEKYSDNRDFHDGRGATVPVYMNTRRGILSNIRKI